MKTEQELLEDITKKAICSMKKDMPAIIERIMFSKSMPLTDESIEMVIDIYTEGLQRGIDVCTEAVGKMALYRITSYILNKGCDDD